MSQHNFTRIIDSRRLDCSLRCLHLGTLLRGVVDGSLVPRRPSHTSGEWSVVQWTARALNAMKESVSAINRIFGGFPSCS
ncbi:uncharacterized protein LOC111273173 isoform X2 [Varroa jacobsoni]|uniref:uncharacterized protein LOC111273173 isoform X2 n=1 Tax=Varroa jacobsoni TaxID=62625 RepID=UPI000BF4CB98|nr:uncharacterized protein LOC111273173 isoform X2 [Varroa jacobsoni]